MSHIPNSAMKHAAPTHHDEPPQETAPAPASRASISGSLIALGGTLLVGAVAAVAVPLWRRRGAAASAKPAARKPRARKSPNAKTGAKPSSSKAAAKTRAPRKASSPKQAEA